MAATPSVAGMMSVLDRTLESVPNGGARKCRRSAARFPGLPPLDSREDRLAGLVRGLVLVEGAQAVGVERGQQRDELAGVEVVVGRGGTGRGGARLGGQEAGAGPHAGAVAQEVLELALVAIGLARRAAQDRLDAQVLA